MRRIVFLVLAGFAVLAGIVQVGPEPAPTPEFELAQSDQTDGAEASPTVWY